MVQGGIGESSSSILDKPKDFPMQKSIDAKLSSNTCIIIYNLAVNEKSVSSTEKTALSEKDSKAQPTNSSQKTSTNQTTSSSNPSSKFPLI
jgi:hypothetical protein